MSEFSETPRFNDNETSDLQQTREFNTHKTNRLHRIIAGSLLAIGALGGTGLAIDGALNLNQAVSVQNNHAQPSNLLVEVFDGFEVVGTALGGAFLLKRGLHYIKTGTNSEVEAQDNIAHNYYFRTNKTNSVIRLLSSASILATSAGIMVGSFMDIDKGVSQTQSSIAQLFNDSLGSKTSDQHNYVISDNPKPDMLNALSVSSTQQINIERKLKDDHLKYVPIYREWETGSRPNNDAEIEFMVLGMPSKITGIPEGRNCSNVYVDTSTALGLKTGQVFQLDGLEVTVNKEIKGNTGFNLLPLVLNSQDFAKCLNENPDRTYNMILTQASPSQIRHLINALNPNNQLQNRIYAVTTQQFINNALLTGENAVNGPVLEIMTVGLLFAGIALSYKSRTTLANNRNQNLMLKANGFNEHLIAKIYNEITENEVFKSSFFALPGVFLVDTMTNMAEPGATLGPDLKTYLTLLGLTWGIGKLSTSYALRKEAHIATFEKGQEL